MADNEPKEPSALNSPDNSNVVKETNKGVAPVEDPLTKRDTDTGNLDKMEDTRTRKTVKLRPVSSPGLIPKLKQTDASNPQDDTQTRTSIRLASGDAPPLVDPIAEPKTDSGKLDKLDETRTRKTVKLKPYTPPEVEPAKKSANELLDDTKTITNITVDGDDDGDAPPLVDPISERKTDTGKLDKLDETRTRKTVKLKPYTPSEGEPGAVKPLQPKPPSPTAEKPLSQPVEDTTTRTSIKLATGAAGENGEDAAQLVDPIAERGTDTGKLDKLDETRTRKTVKLKPHTPQEGEPGAVKPLQLKPLSPVAEKPSSQPVEDTTTQTSIKLASSPGKPGEEDNDIITDPLSARDTDTGSIDRQLDDTRTKKTVKLKPLTPRPGAGVAQIPAPEPPAAVTTDAPQTAPPQPEPSEKPENIIASESVEDTDKDAVVRGPEKVDDTVKISRPKTASGMPVELPLPTVAQAKAVDASKQTVKLKTIGETPAAEKDSPPDKAPDGAADKVIASKATVKLTAPRDGADKPLPAVPAAADKKDSGAPVLKMPGLKPKSADAASQELPPASEEEVKKAGGGLSIKKKSAEEVAEQPAKGPPRVQQDQERLSKARKKTASEASPAYTLMAILTLALLAFTAVVLAAQLHDLWYPELLTTQSLVEKLPYLSELVK